MTNQKPVIDRRIVRSRQALIAALAEEIMEKGLENVTVSNLTDRANLTRRTFYSHYRDVAHLVQSSEDNLLAELSVLQENVSRTKLDDLWEALKEGKSYPGALTLLRFVEDNALYMKALLGPKGDPAFQIKMKEAIRECFAPRLIDGVDVRVIGPFFDYYVEYLIAAQLGVIQRWLEHDLSQSPEEMALIITRIMFVRPGDLYGRPVEQNAPEYLDPAHMINTLYDMTVSSDVDTSNNSNNHKGD